MPVLPFYKYFSKIICSRFLSSFYIFITMLNEMRSWSVISGNEKPRLKFYVGYKKPEKMIQKNVNQTRNYDIQFAKCNLIGIICVINARMIENILLSFSHGLDVLVFGIKLDIFNNGFITDKLKLKFLINMRCPWPILSHDLSFILWCYKVCILLKKSFAPPVLYSRFSKKFANF